jgi:hypothetical protein
MPSGWTSETPAMILLLWLHSRFRWRRLVQEVSEGTMSYFKDIDESKFDYDYVPPHLVERKKNWRNLTVGERLELTWDLSVAAWEKLGVVYDPNKPMDKTIRRVQR